MSKYFLIFLVFVLIAACNSENKIHEFQVKNLSLSEYPDNPDLGYMSANYDYFYVKSGKLEQIDDEKFTFEFKTKNGLIIIPEIRLEEFIPTIPEHVKSDKYLSLLALVNQEWNRNQIKFKKGEFSSDNVKISRIDVARNCLNSYLWELIIYTMEDGKEVPFSHTWFDFPHDLYQKLFLERNGLEFNKYAEHLENWKDLPSKKINTNLLSTNKKEVSIEFCDKSYQMYPLEGARKKKYKEIIYPTRFQNMQDLQKDSSLFATFTPPGFYNKKDPRKTELGRLNTLKKIQLFKVTRAPNKKKLDEIQLHFVDSLSHRQTTFIIGGVDLAKIPSFAEMDVNKAWKNSMGFSNHTFYENYQEHLSVKSKSNLYYSYLCDEKGNWLDSHKVGIDGPVLYWDEEDSAKLHLWILSFERHAFVGHYELIVK